MITALGGGVGASKFLKGLYKIVPSKDLTVIINTADDIDVYGFRVSPDIDTVIYRLSDQVDKKRGWGLKDDSFHCINSLKKLGVETWFQLGDKDMAVQIFKKELLCNGYSSRQVTARTAEVFGLQIDLLPMTEDVVETWIDTVVGQIHFQEYYIKHNMRPDVLGVDIKAIDKATPCEGVIEAIGRSKLIFICPSNPIISIDPILQVRGIRQALAKCKAKVVAISPLIGGKPLKGPTDKLMKGLGLEVSSYEIAKFYKDFLNLMVLDTSDKIEEEKINGLGISSFATDTLISDDVRSEELSKRIIEQIGY